MDSIPDWALTADLWTAGGAFVLDEQYWRNHERERRDHSSEHVRNPPGKQRNFLTMLCERIFCDRTVADEVWFGV
jgi:hypothetical protein